LSRAPVGIVGAGSIGIAWAIVFARAGCEVRVFDPAPERRCKVEGEIGQRLGDLAGADLLVEPLDDIAARVNVHTDLGSALEGCAYVQENAPEDLELKRRLFRDIEKTAGPQAVLASSSSALTASRFAGELETRARCLVVHPGNPPYILDVVEVVPAPFTSPEAVTAATDLLTFCGMHAVRVAREVEGFVFNRLQGALLREAYCLVRDGVATVADIDAIVTRGLGPRWSLIGPFETADLNTRGGVDAHAARMGPAYARMGAERGQNDPWTPDLVARVAEERRGALPLDQWEARVRWRDQALIALARARRTLPVFDPDTA
jgi:3-hydroxyacyl-CoA dehydrogenase